MDIKDYIASGKIEECVLGLASPEEMAELAQFAEKYPEIAAEREAAESSLEALAHAESRPAPVGLKAKVLEEALKEVPPAAADPASEEGDSSSPPPKIIHRFNPWIATTVAASLALFVSLFYNLEQNKVLDSLHEEIAYVRDSVSMLKNNLQLAGLEQDQMQEMLDFVSDPLTRQVALASAVDGKNWFGKVQWQPESGKVLLGVESLPDPGDKAYVLWAIPAEGSPLNISASVPIGSEKFVSWMEQAGQAIAFGITLEEDAAVSSPNLSQLMVVGNV